MTYSVSVIIPNYNNERFLEKCLDSVLMQTYSPKEIIVVDDASTDHSCEIIRRYEKKDSRVIGIYLEQNGGVSHARNVGFKVASGEYITTLDADDFYFNAFKLENEMTLIKKHGGNILAYSKLVYVNEEGELMEYVDLPTKLYFEGNIYYKYLIGSNEKLFIRDYCFPRSLLISNQDIFYDESKNIFEDLDFLIKLLSKLSAYCTFEYGTGYRIKDFGLSHRSNKELYKAKEQVYIENIKRLKKNKARILFYHKLATKKNKLKRYVRYLKKILKNEKF